VSGDEGDLTAFTAAGELYVYQASAQTLTRVFSFGSDGEHELRTLCPLYRIRILSVENGQVDFLLTGYFSGGGEREGCCGLYYFRYDAGDHTLTERMRLDSSESAGLLMRDADRLLYETDDGLLYFSHGDRIFVLDFISGEVSVLVTEEEIDRLAVNEGGTALAWVTGAEKNELRFLDLKTGNGRRIGADPGESFEVLGYMREDLVLGIRREGDPSFRSGSGDVTPFRGLRILDEKGGVVPVPEEGAVLDKQLAETLGAQAGDTVRVDGVPLKITAISDQSVGRTQSVSSTQAQALGEPALRSVICRVQEADEGKLMEFLIGREAYIYSVFTRMAYASYYAIFITYDVPASLVAGFAVLIGLVIVVNTGNTNLLEQKRQLSVLRALGFQQSQISRSWYVQSLLYFLFSLALGLPGGIVVAKMALFRMSVASRTYPFVHEAWVYALTAGLVLAYITFSHFMTMWSMKKWNIVENVKDKE
jgi:hypothetical protein